MIEKRGQHEVEKMKEVFDPKKNGGRRKKRTENSQAHGGGCSVKTRIESTAFETFKERSKEKF